MIFLSLKFLSAEFNELKIGSLSVICLVLFMIVTIVLLNIFAFDIFLIFTRSELGLEPGTEAESVYHVGQVVKCRIVSVIPTSRKLTISFATSSNR